MGTSGEDAVDEAFRIERGEVVRAFAEADELDGHAKLDGSAKGGIVISVQKELGVPVKLVGLGEGPDDLAPFDPEGFVDGILA